MKIAKNFLFLSTATALMLSASLSAKPTPGQRLDRCLDNAKKRVENANDQMKDIQKNANRVQNDALRVQREAENVCHKIKHTN